MLTHHSLPADTLKLSGVQHDVPTVSKAVTRWLSGSSDRDGGRARRAKQGNLQTSTAATPTAATPTAAPPAATTPPAALPSPLSPVIPPPCAWGEEEEEEVEVEFTDL